MRFGNLKLPLKKNAIQFELSAQKENRSKQMIGELYYQYQ